MATRRLFLFGIGGTGSRVIKSLSFLLAAGVKAEAEQIIPIILDPDRENGDLNRTIEILQNYRRVRAEVGNPSSGFFSTEIRTLSSLEEDAEGKNYKLSEGYNMQIDGSKDGRFRDFIHFDHLQEADRQFIHLLFSDQLLNAELGVGFRGNPNMGSVVLNQFKDMDDFRYFANLFKADDRIFIVSSIFGGTGAAGFPLLVKNIREPENIESSKTALLKNARMGAITLLPYFGVEDDARSAIKEGTFISKTKAALDYYRHGVSKSLNALYYLGDPYNKPYKNNEGKEAQKNDAHLAEMVAAMAVLDFLKRKDSEMINREGVIEKNYYLEYGLPEDTPKVTFKSLGDKSRYEIAQGLTQYTYCCKYWSEQLNTSLGHQVWSKGKGGQNNVVFDRSYTSSPFFHDYLRPFNARYDEWLREMARNDRTFAPFNLDTKHLHTLVNGIEQKAKGWLFGSKVEWDYDTFEDVLNTLERDMTQTDPNQKFFNLFFLASQRIYEEKIKARI